MPDEEYMNESLRKNNIAYKSGRILFIIQEGNKKVVFDQGEDDRIERRNKG